MADRRWRLRSRGAVSSDRQNNHRHLYITDPENVNWKSKQLRLDDETLVKQCQRGDSEAMSRLIVRYQDRVYNTILKICNNSDDAAELTQDTFVKVLENITDFRGKSSFYTWLFRVACNEAINFCRRRFKVASQSLDRGMPMPVDMAAEDPARLAQRKEVIALLTEAISRLDEDHRVVLVLRDIEQMSYNQIAQVLGLELGTVKSRLSRARAMLREILETVLT
jgi:RNA polymerase sigma-70 factor (ECF subfamily)